MKECVIVSACRTAIGAFGGSLRDLNCAALGSVVMKEAVRRAGIDPALIDDVRFGCCMEPADALNVTRIAALMAGIPETVTAVTVNRVCISGMEAVVSGHGDDPGRHGGHHPRRRHGAHVGDRLFRPRRPLGMPFPGPGLRG